MSAATNLLSKPFLTIAEVAELVDVSVRTVRRWIASKELSAHRLGRTWRISRHDLAAFLESRRFGIRF